MRDVDSQTDAGINRRRIVQALGGAGTVGLAGCLGGDGPDPEDGGTTTDDDDDAVADGETEFVVTLDEGITSFDSIEITDANTRSATGLVYERLTAVDFDLNVQPVLATSVDPIDDTTVRVPLREGVEFHNGDPFNAYSVKASIERSVGTARDGFISPWYDGAEIIDEHTIEFELVEPFSPLAAEMFPEIQMVPEGAADGDVDLTEQPIGTGPFEFDEHQEGSYFRVRKNENYWFEGDDDVPGEPAVDVVTFRIIGESSTQESALRTGEVDLITTPPTESAESLRDEEDINLHEIAGGTFLNLEFPTKASPYSNRDVREGITRIVPREDIIDVVFNGLAVPAHVLVPPMMVDFRDDEFLDRIKDEYTGHDHDLGVELIEQGFEEEGITAPHETSILTNDAPERTRTAEIMQNVLEGTGLFEVEIVEAEWSAYVDRTGDGEAAERNEIIIGGITGSPSPWEYFNRIVTESGIPPACCNFAEWTDDRMEELLSETAATFEFDEQKPMYEEMMELAAEGAPRAMILWQSEINASRDYVDGWEVFYDPAWQFSSVYAPFAGTYTSLNQ